MQTVTLAREGIGVIKYFDFRVSRGLTSPSRGESRGSTHPRIARTMVPVAEREIPTAGA